MIEVLAEHAPDLPQALEQARAEGLAFVILDGKVIVSDRCREKTESVNGEVIDLWYSGKARCHGGNVQAVARPDGFPLWISPAEPGAVHDITAARAHRSPPSTAPLPSDCPRWPTPATAAAASEYTPL